MTDRRQPQRRTLETPHRERVPRKRASKRRLRALAWIAGGLAFATPFGALAAAPKPAKTAANARAAGSNKPPVTIVRRITKRVVITHPTASAPVQYVAPSSSSSSSSSSRSTNSAPSYNPPPPPTTSTSGS
jgi:hypothetical protein